jgi:hypothetical protein
MHTQQRQPRAVNFMFIAVEAFGFGVGHEPRRELIYFRACSCQLIAKVYSRVLEYAIDASCCALINHWDQIMILIFVYKHGRLLMYSTRLYPQTIVYFVGARDLTPSPGNSVV